jgi:hypothetical protein
MTAADQPVRNVKKPLANRGRPHMTIPVADFGKSFALPLLSRPAGESGGLVSTDKQHGRVGSLTVRKPFRRKRG